MEQLLRTYLQDDEEAMSDFEKGNYTLRGSYDDVILPQIWDRVLYQNAKIRFSRTAPSPPSTRSASPEPTQEVHTASDTGCENRIRYTIKYLRKSRFGGRGYDTDGDSDGEGSFDEPIAFEIDNADDDLPALEEMQEILLPSEAPSRFERKRNKRDHAHSEKNIKLQRYERLGDIILKINSPFLLNIIRSVVSYASESPEDSMERLTKGIFKHPFKDLCLNMEALEDYALPETPLRTRHSLKFNSKFDEHMELLRNYLKGKPGVPLEAMKSTWTRSKPTTSFATLWLLLKPGSDVYVREPDGSLNAYIVDSVRGGIIMSEGRKTISAYKVQVWHLVLGGSDIVPRTTRIDIAPFDNEREIMSLPVFPVRCKDDLDNGETKQRLINRGKRYFRYAKHPVFLQYTGHGLKGGKSVSF
jgi:hypothetical protein